MSVPQVPLGSPGRTPRAFNVPAVVVVFVLICALIELLQAYVLSAEANALLLYTFAFIPARYATPELAFTWQAFTTPVTYSFLHGGLGHLINNCIWLVVFGSPLAATIGNVRFIMFWIVCAGIGALFHYFALTQDMVPMVGASGAISGMMGAAARFGFRMKRVDGGGNRFFEPAPPFPDILMMPNVLVFLAVYLFMNLAIGATGTMIAGGAIAWQAHLGGIVAGFLFAPLVASGRR